MRFLILVVTMIWPLAAFAGETPWQELAPDTRARLISSDVRSPDGTTLVALEIEMPEKVKTYWRIPGETGIPTEIDFSGSTGVAGHEILWPFPLVDTSQGFLDYVYYGPTILPVRVQLAPEATELKASVVMGICSDICVPVTAHFDLPLDFTKADPGHSLRIRQAVASTPIPWPEGSDPIGSIGLDLARERLDVQIMDADVELMSLIATVDDGAMLFGAPQKSPETNLVHLPLLGSGSAAALEGLPIRLTFMTPSGPFETTREILPRATLSAGQ